MGKVRDSIYLLEWIHLITTMEVLAEFTGTYTFSTYSLGSVKTFTLLHFDTKYGYAVFSNVEI